MMNVRELIEALKDKPQDAIVVYDVEWGLGSIALVEIQPPFGATKEMVVLSS